MIVKTKKEETIRHIGLRLVRPYDDELIEHLEKQRNVNHYLRELILRDVEKSKKEQ